MNNNISAFFKASNSSYSNILDQKNKYRKQKTNNEKEYIGKKIYID